MRREAGGRLGGDDESEGEKKECVGIRNCRGHGWRVVSTDSDVETVVENVTKRCARKCERGKDERKSMKGCQRAQDRETEISFMQNDAWYG